jgi:hypothetical protein
MKREAGMKRSNAHASPRVVCPFQKRSVTEANERTPNTVNVFKRDITLPGRSVVRLAATTACQLQLCTVLGNTAIQLSDRGCD